MNKQIYSTFNYNLGSDLPSFSEVLPFDPPGAHRQGLPDPHHARPAFDGERTVVPAQMMFDNLWDLYGFIHVGVRAYSR